MRLAGRSPSLCPTGRRFPEFVDNDRLPPVSVSLGQGIFPVVTSGSSVDNRLFVIGIPLEEAVSILYIIMQRQNVRNGMLPAVVRNNRTVWINGFGEVVNTLGKLLLLQVTLNVRNPHDSLNGTQVIILGWLYC